MKIKPTTTSLDRLAELMEEIKQTPKVDVIILSPEGWEKVKAALPDVEREPTPAMMLGAVKVYLHWALGDVIVYGDSDNKIIKTILSTCEKPKTGARENIDILVGSIKEK